MTQTGSGAPSAAAVADARIPRGLVLLLSGLSMTGMLGANLYLPSLPSMAAELSASPRLAGASLSVFLASFAFAQLLVGPLSDRFGRRPVLLGGLLLFALSSLACAAADSIELLLIFRAVQGLAACAGSVVVRAVVRDLFEGATLNRIFAVISTLIAIAPGFSPLLGGFVEMQGGWRANFLVLTALAMLLMVLTWRMLAESNRKPASRLAFRPVLEVYRSIWGSGEFNRPALVTASALGGLFAFFAASPDLFIGRLGYSAAWFGAVPAGTVFAVFAGGASGPRLARKLGSSRAIALSTGIMLAGALAMLLAISAFGEGSLAVLAPLVVYLYGMGIAIPLATAAAITPQGARAGTASALIGFYQILAGALSSIAVAALGGPLALPGLLALFAAAAFSCGLPRPPAIPLKTQAEEV